MPRLRITNPKTEIASNLTTKPNFYALDNISDAEVLARYNEIWKELKRRKIVRSSNNIVADYAEKIASEKLGLSLSKQSTKGYDATDTDGKRYQIKARKASENHAAMQMGIIRDLNDNPFDFLVIVLFNDDFSIRGMWELPVDTVRKHTMFSKHQNGHILVFKKKIKEDPTVKRLA